MRIAVVGPQFPDSFAQNVSATLEAMGNEVLCLDGRLQKLNSGPYAAAVRTYLPKAFPAIERWMQRRLIAAIADFRPALVLVTYDLFGAETVERVKRAGQAPVVCWYIDPIANLSGGRLFNCPYDAFFIKEPQLAAIMYDKLAFPAHYLPEACNPKWHRPVTPTAQQLLKYG